MKKESNTYDVIVIGAGAAGLNSYSFLHQTGLTVLLVEKNEKNIGGDCLHNGCIPSKALIHLAKSGFTGDLAEAIHQKQSAIATHESLDFFKEQGWDICIGEAHFVDRGTIEVDGRTYRAKKIIVATGSKPRMLTVSGTPTFPIYSNETIFGIQQAPKNFVVVGGGPIGVEIAQAYSKLGSHVSIITTDGQLLPRERIEVGEYIEKIFAKNGITVYKEASIAEAHLTTLTLTTGVTLTCDALLVAIGRVVDIRSLMPEKAGIVIDEQGRPKVDRCLRSTNHNIYFSGDAVGSYQFTHVTERHTAIILQNLFGFFKKAVSYRDIGWVTFTDPEIASCGISHDEYLAHRDIYKEYVLPFTEDDRAITDEYTDSMIWIYTHGEYIVGATIIMPGAGEVMQSILYAISNSIKIRDLFSTLHPYPTKSRILKSIFALHQKERFTKTAKSVLRVLFKVFS